LFHESDQGDELMNISVEAIYQNGWFKPKAPLQLAEGPPVRLIVAPIDDARGPLDEVIGIVKDGPDFSLAERHDEVVSGGCPRSR
jgi:predicted DNA-binding antitoxin AbrB/MazE fold protein